MVEKLNSMSQDLYRQRKYLIILSTILWFMKFSKINISTFSIFGIQFEEFNNPNAIYMLIWILWTYYLFRYAQYFLQEGFQKLKNEYLVFLEKLCTKKINGYIIKNNINVSEYTYTALKKSNWEIRFKEKKGINGYGGDSYKKNKIKIPKYIFFDEYAKSLLMVIFYRSAFLDYVFPIFLALYVFIYCQFRWDGAIFTIVR